MKLTQFWMASIYIQNWMTLIVQIQMKVTVVNIIQNRMTLIIQTRMKVTVVNIIQNWMTLIIQIRMKVTVVNIIEFPYHHPKHASQGYQGISILFKAHIA